MASLPKLDMQALRRLGGVLAFVAVFVAGVVVGGAPEITAQQVNPNTRMPAEAEEAFAPFWEAYNLIQKTYLEPVDTTLLVDGAIDGMVTALEDQFSGYVEPEFNAFDDNLSGSISGIGVVIEMNEDLNRIQIITVYGNTPAERAGLEAGDIFLSVNDEDVTSFGVDRVAARVRGQTGTVVNIRILRGDEELDFAIERARIEIPIIETDVLEGNVAYIEFSSFTADARGRFDRAVAELDVNSRSGLVIDLRGNPGGLLSTAVSMASALVEDGVVLYEQFGDGTEQIFEADGTKLDIRVPIVVLVNESSASASELVVGAWQDYDLATIVGTTTFGKGVVQIQRDLVNGGGLRLTIARWLSPNRTSIHLLGITPDIVVEWDIEARRANPEDDPQLQAALEVLRTAVPTN